MLKGKFFLLSLEFLGFLFALQAIFYKQVQNRREEKIESFFQTKKDYDILEEPYTEEKEPYLGIIEIPIIELKAGFYEKTSLLNSVDYGIEVLERSKMPDEKGNLLLASHSGTSFISYFRNLHHIKQNDIVYIYYNKIKYTYQIIQIYEEKRDSSISVPKVENYSLLTLTTCKEDKQLIVIGKQISFYQYE